MPAPDAYGLFLYVAPDSCPVDDVGAVYSVLSQRARDYVAGRGSDNSGFDLEVYSGVADQTDAPEALMTTRVRAKVFSYDTPGVVYGHTLMLRSSVPKRYGWMLGNGVGLIDRSYCDPLMAYLVRTPGGSGAGSAPTSLHGSRALQVVAPNVQPFEDVVVTRDEAVWRRFLAQYAPDVADRGGGFGSTGV
jgi:dUTPase